jgi:hypothetical protein
MSSWQEVANTPSKSKAINFFICGLIINTKIVFLIK